MRVPGYAGAAVARVVAGRLEASIVRRTAQAPRIAAGTMIYQLWVALSI